MPDLCGCHGAVKVQEDRGWSNFLDQQRHILAVAPEKAALGAGVSIAPEAPRGVPVWNVHRCHGTVGATPWWRKVV